MEHWMLHCLAVQGFREEAWEKAQDEVGQWIRELAGREQLLMAVGRIPERCGSLMMKKGKFRPMESVGQGMERLQAAMAGFGITMAEKRKERGGMGLRPEEGKACIRCGAEEDGLLGGRVRRGGICWECENQGEQQRARLIETQCDHCGAVKEEGGWCGGCDDLGEDCGEGEDDPGWANDEEREHLMGVCQACGNMVGRSCGCGVLMGGVEQEGGRQEEGAGRERLSTIRNRIMWRTGRPQEEVVREYLRQERDEEKTVAVLGEVRRGEVKVGGGDEEGEEEVGMGKPRREGAPSPDRGRSRQDAIWDLFQNKEGKLLRDFERALGLKEGRVAATRKVIRRVVVVDGEGMNVLPGEFREGLKRRKDEGELTLDQVGEFLEGLVDDWMFETLGMAES